MADTRRKPKTTGTLSQAGLETQRFRSQTLALEEICGASLVRIHGLDPPAIVASCPLSLPKDVGVCAGEDPVALCLRPGEWLVASEKLGAEELWLQAAEKADPKRTAVLDISDSLAFFRLTGAGAAWLLCKVSGLDYISGSKQGPHCASTKLGRVAAIVHYHPLTGAGNVFDLLLDRSIARYAWSLLTESSSHADELANIYGGAAPEA